ncbi:MAG: hypothetical protein M3441_02405 [Chloroflexota bacterium]|nr:hypothetical protein [Chloroflexota bacterium]
MADNNSIQDQGLSEEELQSQDANALPDREAMSLINANLALPVNAAVAANVLSDGSIAYADADQQALIDQSTGGGNWTDLADDAPTGG